MDSPKPVPSHEAQPYLFLQSGPRTELVASQEAPHHLAPTWDVVFLEDSKMLLSDPLDVLQRDVIDLTADAFHRVLGRC